MPLKMGMKPEIVSSNIREMMKSGKNQKEAIAAAMAMKRKSQKMAEGGKVMDFDEGVESDLDDGAERGLPEINEMGKYHPSTVENPSFEEKERQLARKLYEASEAEEMSYAMGGLVQPVKTPNQGNQPDLGWINEGTSEPMSELEGKKAELSHSMIEGVPESSMLSEAVKMAIEEKRKKRRYV